MADDQVERWRSIADLDDRAGQPVGEALREAADEVEKLREQLRCQKLDHIDSLLGRIEAIRSDRALMRQLYTAWWSARIGRARARQEVANLNATLTLVGSSVMLVREHTETVTAELDRFKVAVATMREDHEGCVIGAYDGCQTCIALDTLDKPQGGDQS